MNVTIYTMPNCVQCDQTKRYLDKGNVPYETIDISTNPEAYDKVKEMGYMSAPVVVTDLYGSWSGFRLAKLAQLTHHS